MTKYMTEDMLATQLQATFYLEVRRGAETVGAWKAVAREVAAINDSVRFAPCKPGQYLTEEEGHLALVDESYTLRILRDGWTEEWIPYQADEWPKLRPLRVMPEDETEPKPDISHPSLPQREAPPTDNLTIKTTAEGRSMIEVPLGVREMLRQMPDGSEIVTAQGEVMHIDGCSIVHESDNGVRGVFGPEELDGSCFPVKVYTVGEVSFNG